MRWPIALISLMLVPVAGVAVYYLIIQSSERLRRTTSRTLIAVACCGVVGILIGRGDAKSASLLGLVASLGGLAAFRVAAPPSGAGTKGRIDMLAVILFGGTLMAVVVALLFARVSRLAQGSP